MNDGKGQPKVSTDGLNASNAQKGTVKGPKLLGKLYSKYIRISIRLSVGNHVTQLEDHKSSKASCWQ